MIPYLLLLVAVVVIGLVAYVATRPAEFQIVRTATLPAPPEKVFAQVEDFRLWDAWSPWARIDPKCVFEYSGAERGVGAHFTWSGNNQVGSGAMTLRESDSPRRILIDLVFTRPMQATNLTEFTFFPEGRGTLVSWKMTGRNHFMAKAFNVLVNVDRMVGGQFEQGLANLGSVISGGTRTH